ncbi:type III polyketide synthase [Parvularcula dongshanensis]|uniref:Putative naringenin-chalcone synthase n=1 Tax=Parvularcula dongshanensis TaxID=1173995 RepID=A0A840I646_9PROT|nr:putative naringenin-chalcone synthase [Parvularcula dongshanensis]
MTRAHLNAASVAVPDHEVHGLFKDFARRQITDRRRVLLDRMMERSGIEARWSTLTPAPSEAGMDAEGFYRFGSFPSTAERMRVYDREATTLAERAARGLGTDLSGVTHLLVTSCTGFAAPGVDLQLVDRLGLDPGVERTLIGFMGCYAAINALRLARQIVLAEPDARVLCVSVELCTLHLQETDDLETVLSFSIFGDGAAAALVTADPFGFSLDKFRTQVMPDERSLITWHVGDQGFDMVLSGEVPSALKRSLPEAARAIVPEGHEEIGLWAVHPGGRSILDVVEASLALPSDALLPSREVLRRFGNMSSPTVLFVLEAMLRAGAAPGTPGLALAFGPGLTAEAMRFTAV